MEGTGHDTVRILLSVGSLSSEGCRLASAADRSSGYRYGESIRGENEIRSGDHSAMQTFRTDLLTLLKYFRRSDSVLRLTRGSENKIHDD